MDHPAILAWRRFTGEKQLPSGAIKLKAKRNRGVYRLYDARPDGQAIIAKRSYHSRVQVEDKIYRHVLSGLSLSSPSYYGFLEEDDVYCWLFLEDVGGERISYTNLAHQTAAATWLGQLHILTATAVSRTELVDRGPDHYLDYLHSGQTRIRENLGNPSMTREDRAMLSDLIAQLDSVTLDWGMIIGFCQELPRTVVHGDFQAKNIRIRQSNGQIQIFPLDWELAGWGVPATDLSPSLSPNPVFLVNMARYWQIVRDHKVYLSYQQLERMVVLGYLFRHIAAINWASASLHFEPPKKAIELLTLYHRNLGQALKNKAWIH